MTLRNPFVALVLLGAMASAATINVPATANIFGAGHATPPAPGGNGGGILPPLYSLPAGTGRTLTFSSVTGSVSCCASVLNSNGPDGGLFASGDTDIFSYGGISGISNGGHTMFLVGVFLTGDEPVDPAPPRLDFTASEDFAGISPLIAQIFFIGDGLTGTGSGTVQQFTVPDLASRLYLGFADSLDFGNPTGNPGSYGDNLDSLTATFDITPLDTSVPEPATLAMLGIGLAALLGFRRRG